MYIGRSDWVWSQGANGGTGKKDKEMGGLHASWFALIAFLCLFVFVFFHFVILLRF